MNHLKLYTIKLISDPVALRVMIFVLLLALLVLTALAPSVGILADGIPGGPRPTP